MAGNGALAEYDDYLVFTSSDPTATFADVSVNLLLDGDLNAAAADGAAAGSLEGYAMLSGVYFRFLYDQESDGRFFGSTDLSASGVTGATMNLSLTSPTVRVTLGVPTAFSLVLQSTANASGTASSGLSDFSGSFKLPSGGNAFNLPEGVTVNAGDYLIDNRFFDPLAAAVPEPAAWALMMLGLGMVGADLRRRRSLNAQYAAAPGR